MSKREYSNAGKYPCPTCNHMNPIANIELGICMSCMGGDKYSRFIQTAVKPLALAMGI